jgi:pectinesterase
MNKIIVSCDGTGDFKTVCEALEKASENTEIFVKKGVYKEKIVVTKPNIAIVGEDKENAVLTFDSYAREKNSNGDDIGTFKTASVKVERSAAGFSAYNITIENSAGSGDVVGQAVALYLDCDKATVKSCILRARQDTLLTAPMHEDIAIEPERKNRQYFEDCLIEGDVDFIFGGAAAVFKSCEIKSLNRNKENNGYVTAACTAKPLKYGYVFFDCNFTTDSCRDETVYLGRPWREFARTVLINCNLGSHIRSVGFSKWNDTDRHKTCYYAQYNSKGKHYDESKLAQWTYVLDEKQAAEYTIENIFEGWSPKCR